jgi:hypothetical protein
MDAGLARLRRQPGKQDEFLLCLYEKISSRLLGQFCYIDIVLTVVKNTVPLNFHPGKPGYSLFVSVYKEKFPSR